MVDQIPLTVVEVVPRAGATIAVQNTGKQADLHRIAAWVIDNGGQVSIQDNYDVQGPDILHIMSRKSGNKSGGRIAVGSGDWIVVISYGNFQVMTDDRFNAIYELRNNLKQGDPRGGLRP